MQKFFKSGNAFFLVGILCLIAGLLSEHSTVFISVGLVWIMIGIIVRKRKSQKGASQDEAKK